MKEKKIWKKEFESGTGSSCLISVEKIIKNKAKPRKRGRKKMSKKLRDD